MTAIPNLDEYEAAKQKVREFEELESFFIQNAIKNGKIKPIENKEDTRDAVGREKLRKWVLSLEPGYVFSRQTARDVAGIYTRSVGNLLTELAAEGVIICDHNRGIYKRVSLGVK